MSHLQHFTQCTYSPQQYLYIYTFLNWQAFKHWNFIMSHLHLTQCICIPHSSTHTYILSWTGKPSNTETSSCHTYNILPSVHIPHSSTCTYILSWTGKPSNTETSSCHTYIWPSVYAFPTAVLIHIYFPELASLQTLKLHHVTLTTFYPVYIFPTAVLVHIYFPELASLQTLKLHHVTLKTFDPVYAFPTAVLIHIYFPELASLQTLKLHHVTLTFDPVYMHSPQQYSYIYTFLNWQAFKHWNFIMLHLKHLTQCMHSPEWYSYIFTFLNWQAFKHWNFIMSHLQHFTQCICIPHSSTHTYILSWTGKPSNTGTSSCYTYNILPSECIPHSSTCTYTFLNWQAFKHWKFIVSHLQHFTQCIYAFPTLL